VSLAASIVPAHANQVRTCSKLTILLGFGHRRLTLGRGSVMNESRAQRSAVRFTALAGGFAAWLGTAAIAAESAEEPARNAQLLDKLVASYPDFLASHDANTLIWKDGQPGYTWSSLRCKDRQRQQRLNRC